MLIQFRSVNPTYFLPQHHEKSIRCHQEHLVPASGDSEMYLPPGAISKIIAAIVIIAVWMRNYFLNQPELDPSTASSHFPEA